MNEVRTRSLRLPTDIAERLRLIAFRLRKSQNAIIVEALATALYEQENLAMNLDKQEKER